MVKITNQAVAAEQFAEYWKDKGYEKGECQPFWLSLLSKVFGVEEPENLSNLRIKYIWITLVLLMDLYLILMCLLSRRD